jgi:DNA-binding NarL/FixJ family response regulator
MPETIGMEAFAERARPGLRAAGGTARRRAATARVQLTAQEAQIARLAADGLSNPWLQVDVSAWVYRTC